MTDVYQKFVFHGDTAGTLVEAEQVDDTAWLNINSFVHPAHTFGGPEVTIHFARGLQGRQQILELIDQLEKAAVGLLAHREQADVAELVR